MKKRVSIFLAVVFLFSIFSNVFAVELNDTTLDFDLTYNGENIVTVDTGEVITVEYNLENVSADEGYSIQTVANEISFDNEFFEYLGDSQIRKGEFTATGKENVYSSGEHRIYFNGSHLNGQTYSQKQFMGSFKLKVKARSGSSVISSKEISAYDNDGKKYNLTSTNLTVFVGNAPSELYTVKYINNGEVYKTVSIAGNMQIESSPSVPNGYRFGGWKCKTDGRIYQTNDVYNVTEDVEFTAVWEEIVPPAANYTLTFITNGGSDVNPTNSITKVENTIIDLSEYTSTKSGYTFKGWYSDSTLTNKVTSVTLDSNKTVYAKWERVSTDVGGGGSGSGVVKYTISFETNGGTEIASVSKMKDITVDLSKYVTKKEGFTFGGWYTDKELKNRVEKIKVTGNITLYAKWIEGENGGEDKNQPNYKPDILTDDHYAYIVGRENGYFYPNDDLTRAETAEMIFRLLKAEIRQEALTKENGFSDVGEGDWFNASVSTLANLGIVKGRTESSFAPNENITRAEFTTIVARISDVKYEGESLFKDVAGHWAENNINIAAYIGWVEGENGFFRPDENITRAEVVTLLNRVLCRVPEKKSDLLGGMITPPDNSDETAWYYLAVQEAVNSHDFEMKSDNVHERWTSLTENPDWSNLDK